MKMTTMLALVGWAARRPTTLSRSWMSVTRSDSVDTDIGADDDPRPPLSVTLHVPAVIVSQSVSQ